jgi:hypothetical protein
MAKLIEKNLKTKEAIILLKRNKKEYDKAWRNFWKLGKKIAHYWKTKKTSLEILREERD